jgi:hypothetical protein
MKAIAYVLEIILILVLDAILSIVPAVIALSISGWWYNSHHAIPDPVERGEDVGLALFGFYWGGVVFLISFVILFFVLYSAKKNLLKKKRVN